ncbi:uncharacterized protein LOC143835599 isoform X5 [Paroedura picta]|uniref:uncharacterized protein LOC143835599 isoform X5 n=1 Tax=Paroedura picta TaxID=143630 RepID=UPI004055CA8D
MQSGRRGEERAEGASRPPRASQPQVNRAPSPRSAPGERIPPARALRRVLDALSESRLLFASIARPLPISRGLNPLSPKAPVGKHDGKSGKMPLQKTMSGVQRRREDPARGSKKTDRIMTSTPLLLNISIRSHCQILETTISEYPLLLNYIKNSTQAGPHVETDIEFDPALCQWKAVTITDLHGFSRPPLIPSGFEEMAAGGRESKVDLQSLYLIQTLMAINTLLL